MTILFVFFVLPLVTILLAIVLQKILKSPILVAITFFAIFLIVAFVAFPDNLAAAIIGAIILAIIAFITAVIVQLICLIRNRLFNNEDRRCSCRRCNCRRCCCRDDDDNSSQSTSDSGNLLRISCNCQNGESNDLLTINSNCNCNNSDNDSDNDSDSDDSNSCGCNSSRGGFVLSADVVSGNNRRRCGCNRGCFRRY